MNDYVKRTKRNLITQTASELTYYDGLKRFLETIFPSKKRYLVQTGYKIKNSGNKPDMTVLYNGMVLFHIEAKRPGTPLDHLLKTAKSSRFGDQIVRYRQEGVQLLLTDFLQIGLVDPSVPNTSETPQKFLFKCTLIERSGSSFIQSDNAVPKLQHLVRYTCEDHIITIANIKKLIPPLANIASIIKEKANYLMESSNTGNFTQNERISAAYLQNIYEDFKRSLFKEEREKEQKLFADLFAQTIVYGTFSAWMKYTQKDSIHSTPFVIRQVGDFLPFGSFLRDLFLNFKNKIPGEFKAVLHEMEILFQKTEVKPLHQEIESLITTFYSDFLTVYDPKTAKERGVVYTPHEIVEYMIDGIDFMLKRWLDKASGIISEVGDQGKTDVIDRLRILDPAAGTMAFASGLLHGAKKQFLLRYPHQPTLCQGAFEQWVKNEFFQNMHAFEILMAPYVLGHIRVFLTLEELGIVLNAEEFRLKSFLMNTLMTPPHQRQLDEWMFNYQEIGKEIKEALRVRDLRDIYVIMGNPPYNLSSQNNCEWINEKILDYKRNLDERNKKILSDDYVKFIRFAQWKIEQVGTGVVALITNNHFLDGQMFSVMRKSLHNSFDHIYVVNLHGDMRKNESGNPFDIRVGVCITFMVRNNKNLPKHAAIHYRSIDVVTREEKFLQLSIGFRESDFVLLPDTSADYFTPMVFTHLARYEQYPTIDQFFIIPPMSGIMVGRDRLLVDTDRANVNHNLDLFFAQKYDALESLQISSHDTKSWSRADVFRKTTCEQVKSAITLLLYRGWDFRYLAYHRDIVEGHRMGYMDQINTKNPAITVTRSSRKSVFCTSFMTNIPVEKCYMSITDTAYVFLLKNKGKSNIKGPKLPFSYSDTDFFYYLYGILWAPTYRNRYDEYLRKGFPRIPITTDSTQFFDMSEIGYHLAQVHLLNLSIDPSLEIAEIPSDHWIIRDYIYDPAKNCLFFEDPKKIETNITDSIPWIRGITPAMWEFSIGLIPQLAQFLNSRVYSMNRKWNTLQRGLSYEEILYFLKMCSAIKIHLEILPQLDQIYQQIEPINAKT